MALAFPSNPSVNQVYQYGLNAWRWDGEAWNVYPSSMLNVQVVAAEVSTDKPTSNVYQGKMWYNSQEGKMYIYYDGAWIGVQ
jgi:hypothetical protein